MSGKILAVIFGASMVIGAATFGSMACWQLGVIGGCFGMMLAVMAYVGTADP